MGWGEPRGENGSLDFGNWKTKPGAHCPGVTAKEEEQGPIVVPPARGRGHTELSHWTSVPTGCSAPPRTPGSRRLPSAPVTRLPASQVGWGPDGHQGLPPCLSGWPWTGTFLSGPDRSLGKCFPALGPSEPRIQGSWMVLFWEI